MSTKKFPAATIRAAWQAHSDRIVGSTAEAIKLYCYAESCGLTVDDEPNAEKALAEYLMEGCPVDLIAHAINIQSAEDEPSMAAVLVWLAFQNHLILEELEAG